MFEFFTVILFLGLIGSVIILLRTNAELSLFLSQESELLQMTRQFLADAKERNSELHAKLNINPVP